MATEVSWEKVISRASPKSQKTRGRARGNTKRQQKEYQVTTDYYVSQLLPVCIDVKKYASRTGHRFF